VSRAGNALYSFRLTPRHLALLWDHSHSHLSLFREFHVALCLSAKRREDTHRLASCSAFVTFAAVQDYDRDQNAAEKDDGKRPTI